MHRLRFICIETLAAAIVLIPILLLLWKVYFRNTKKIMLYTIFALYLSAVYTAVGLPTITYLRLKPTFNFIPFLDMVADFKNAVLNIVLFVPFGMLLPLLWDKFRTMKSTIFFGLGMSLVIEFLQVFASRTTDINDIITNVTGTIIGYLIANMIIKKAPQFIKPSKKTSEIFILYGTTFLVMFFVQPFISSVLWGAVL